MITVTFPEWMSYALYAFAFFYCLKQFAKAVRSAIIAFGFAKKYKLDVLDKELQ